MCVCVHTHTHTVTYTHPESQAEEIVPNSTKTESSNNSSNISDLSILTNRPKRSAIEIEKNRKESQKSSNFPSENVKISKTKKKRPHLKSSLKKKHS